jgi:hypothetical protein
VAEFGPAQAGEVGFCAVGAGTADAVAVLVIDALHRKAGMQRVPSRALIGMERRALKNTLTDAGQGCVFGSDDRRPPVCPGHSLCECVDQRGAERSLRGQVLERCCLVKAAEVHGPFHDQAAAAEAQTKPIPGDGHHAQIQTGGIVAIDNHLRLAGGLPCCRF